MSGIGTMVVSALVVAAEAVRQARRFGTHGALHRALYAVSDPAQDPQW